MKTWLRSFVSRLSKKSDAAESTAPKPISEKWIRKRMKNAKSDAERRRIIQIVQDNWANRSNLDDELKNIERRILGVNVSELHKQ